MQTERTKILYIAYYFPPLGSVASIRSIKMVRYLRDQGITPVVMTLCPRLIRLPKDKHLLAELPTDTPVYRFRCFDFSWIYKLLWGLKLGKLVNLLQQRVLIPDQFKLCLGSAEAMLKRIIADHPDIRCAVISGSPFSSFHLGSTLRNRYHIPFICDWRDEWTNNPERLNISYPATSQSKELLEEAAVIASAEGNVFLTQAMKLSFESRYGKLAHKPSRVIPNGYDENDFHNLPAQNRTKGFRLLYTGSFYDRRQPDKLWTAILSLIAEGKLDERELNLDIIGKNSPSFVLGRYSEDPIIRQIIRFQPFLPHAQTLAEMMNCDALLLYIPSGKNTGSVLTGKLFDYLRSGKPVLAIIPSEGIAANYLRKAGTGYIADYDDPDGIKETLNRLLSDHRNGALHEIKPDMDFISAFSRQKQAVELASLIREVIKTNETTSI